MIGSYTGIMKKVDYFCCIEGKGVLKDIRCIVQNIMLFISLLENIFCVMTNGDKNLIGA